MPTRFENLGESYGIPSDGARGADARYKRMRPISGVTLGAETPRGVYYNEKCGPLRSGDAASDGGAGRETGSASGGVPEQPKKKLGNGWKGQHRPLFGDPKDGQNGSSGNATGDKWDILSGDDLL